MLQPIARLSVVAAVFASLVSPQLLASPPATAAASSWPTGRMDTFVRGPDNAMWHRSFDGASWTPWESLGGTLTADPAAVSWGSGRIDAFVRGPDFALWHMAFDGTVWSGWERLGGALTSGPAAASWSAGHLDVFVRGYDRQLYHKSFDLSTNAWSDWEGLGGTLTSNPSAVSWGSGRIDVFARGPDLALWHRSFHDGAWSSGWDSLGGYLTAAPAVASWGAGRLDVFVAGGDYAAWHRSFHDSGWSGWDSLGGSLTSDPSATAWGGNTVAVFVRGPDLSYWYRSWSGSWSNWQSLGGRVLSGSDPITIPVPIYRQDFNLDCETASLQMGLAAFGHSYSQSSLFALEKADTRAPVLGPIVGGFRTVLQWGDPYTNFVGDVNGSDTAPTGYGVYYPLILQIAQSHGMPGAAGGEFFGSGTVYDALANLHPVAVWVEVAWAHPPVRTWTAWDGRQVRYSLEEHTVVLTGLTDDAVRVNDPWHGTQYWVSRTTFEASWRDFNDMAIVFQ
jgi:uncharacterized protein YvpB